MLCLHDAGCELHGLLEIKVGLRLPLLENFQCIAQEFAVLETGESLGGFVAGLCTRGTNDPAQRCKESGFAAVSLGSEEAMKGAGGGTAASVFWSKPPTPPLCDELVAGQAAPCNDGLSARAMRHHADGQLITPEVSAQLVVCDVNFHDAPSVGVKEGFAGNLP
jgi:hypothetical protein